MPRDYRIEFVVRSYLHLSVCVSVCVCMLFNVFFSRSNKKQSIFNQIYLTHRQDSNRQNHSESE